jgi:hypothetical protein
MKKRIALILGTVGLVVFLAAGVAFAMTITGTSAPNNITATNKADNIAASANRDLVNGRVVQTGSLETGAMTPSTEVLPPTT